jgi:hypothetical protein
MSVFPGHVCGPPGPWALRFPEWCRQGFHLGHFGCCCPVPERAMVTARPEECEQLELPDYARLSSATVD